MRASLALVSLALAQTTFGLYIKDRQADVSLDELIKAKGKEYCGVATDKGLLTANTNAAIIQANFGQVTPENSMKWESIQRTLTRFVGNQYQHLTVPRLQPRGEASLGIMPIIW